MDSTAGGATGPVPREAIHAGELARVIGIDAYGRRTKVNLAGYADGVLIGAAQGEPPSRITSAFTKRSPKVKVVSSLPNHGRMRLSQSDQRDRARLAPYRSQTIFRKIGLLDKSALEMIKTTPSTSQEASGHPPQGLGRIYGHFAKSQDTSLGWR